MKANIKMKTSLSLLMLVATVVTYAQGITISGKLQPGNYKGLALTNGSKDIDVPVQVSAENTFRLAIPTLTKGYYSLGNLKLYLEPGFNLELSPETQSYRFTGKGAIENNLMVKTNQLGTQLLGGRNHYEWYNIKPDSMLNIFERYRAAVNQEVAGVSNLYFKAIFLKDMASSCRNMLTDYKQNYGLDSVILKEIDALATSTYYTDPFDRAKMTMILSFALKQDWLSPAQNALVDQQIAKDFDWNDEVLYQNSPDYRKELLSKIEKAYTLKGSTKPPKDPGYYTDQMRVIDETVLDITIKEALKSTLAVQYLKMEKDELRMDSMYKEFVKLKMPKTIRDMIVNQYKNAKVLKSNPESINFSYQDVSGRMVTLRDLRGKYVYIDVWATWCAPCKAEIPSLKKVEKEYRNKNIAFVSLSIDRQADKDKWKAMVKDLHLEGIQVIADKDLSSDFIQMFQIAVIPRFILIAPDGKIVSADAFRPSDPKLKEQLDQLL